MPTKNINGFHILADFCGCKKLDILRHADSLEKALRTASKKAGFKIVGSVKHQFKPFGATVVLLLSTSHFSAHSWPEENGFVAIDIYSCSGRKTAERAFKECIKIFKPEKIKIKKIERYK